MADAEAIREARRRRILQSSESRMNRFTGRLHQAEADNPEERADNVQEIQEPAIPENTGSETTLRQRQINNDSGEPQAKLVRNTVKVSPLKRPLPLPDQPASPTDSLNSSRSSSEAKMILKHFEFLRIVMCVMVAYLCRRVLVTGYGIFYFQSVVLPFAAMEAAFFAFKSKVLHNVTLPHKSSMLIGVLMLCGIKPDILNLYNKIMGYFSAASEDFALFFFSFMMANMVMA